MAACVYGMNARSAAISSARLCERTEAAFNTEPDESEWSIRVGCIKMPVKQVPCQLVVRAMENEVVPYLSGDIGRRGTISASDSRALEGHKESVLRRHTTGIHT